MRDLHVITPALAEDDLLQRALAALAGAEPGRVALHLRTKHLSREQSRRLARQLRGPTRERGVALVINQYLDIATECSADAVQLPETTASVAHARRTLGASIAIGRSCHDRSGLERAMAEGADFAFLAPVYDVPGKGTALLPDGFAQQVRGLALPIYALGGITRARIPDVMRVGAAGVAVVREVFEATQPDEALRDCLRAIEVSKV